jgi:hypothetical protein
MEPSSVLGGLRQASNARTRATCIYILLAA